MRRLIFVGGLGSENQFGGELTKNKFLVNRLKDFFNQIFVVDTYKSRKYPWKLFLLPFYIVLFPNTPIVFSTSYGNIKVVVKFLKTFYRRRRVILWAIGGNLHEMIAEGVYNSRDFKYFYEILVEGQRIKVGLNKLGVHNVRIVTNFKKCKEYMPNISNKVINESDKLRMVFFSRIMPEKGCNLILEAVRCLNLKGLSDAYSVDFYGVIDESYNEFNEQLECLENVSYHGVLNFFDYSGIDVLSKYHVTLFPTFWRGEGFPGVIVDSYLAGLPIIASDWSLNAEIVLEDTGCIIPVNDVNALIGKMEYLISHKELLNPMFKNAQQRAMQYDVNNVVNEKLIVELFQ